MLLNADLFKEKKLIDIEEEKVVPSTYLSIKHTNMDDVV